MRKREPERQIILASPKRRPYGARLSLLLEKQTKFPMKGECVLLVSPEIIVRMSPRGDDTEGKVEQHWDIFIEGFATAGEAEQAGLKIALGFLCAAMSGRYSVRLIYHTPLPCAVYDRTQQKRLKATFNANLSIITGISNIVEPLNKIISSPLPIDQKLLVACELFAAARLETTERTRFVGIVSSLEPLTIQQKYNEETELIALITTFKESIQNSMINGKIRDSLVGRVEQLKTESISMAIKRLVEETVPNDPGAVELIEEAYSLRSKILHEGSTDADLELKGREVENVVRQIFEAKVKQYLIH
jgi:hypothetical protein